MRRGRGRERGGKEGKQTKIGRRNAARERHEQGVGEGEGKKGARPHTSRLAMLGYAVRQASETVCHKEQRVESWDG